LDRGPQRLHDAHLMTAPWVVTSEVEELAGLAGHAGTHSACNVMLASRTQV
jgi:hypothetical protein